MLIERYFEAAGSLLQRLSADTEPIRQAAELCADALAAGHALHIYDSGHMVSEELVRRAGGLVAFSRLAFNLEIDNLVRTRAGAPAPGYRYIEHVFDGGTLRPGDVLFVGSVSGKSAGVVELAQQARAHGLKVIALTSVTYSSQLSSDHPSGRRLYEEGDVVLDNGAPYGDGMMPVEGLDVPLCPASGLGAALVLWAVTAGIVENLLARGIVPTVYPSVNLPGGVQLVQAADDRAAQKGY
jgi:uncharacterized phosphosugar-binding protein